MTDAFGDVQLTLWKAGSLYLVNDKLAHRSTLTFVFSLQEPLEMKFPSISYSALALMKVRKRQLVEGLCAEAEQTQSGLFIQLVNGLVGY